MLKIINCFKINKDISEMLQTFSRALDFPLAFAFCFLLAAIPILVWFFFFGRPLFHKKGHLILTFVTGMLAAGVILAYQYFWNKNIDFIFFELEPKNFKTGIEGALGMGIMGSFFTFLSVGFLEEYMKHWMTKKTDHSIFESIDDVIEFSIVGALGFAFLENIGYFFQLVISEGSSNLFSLFFVRSVFVVFIHVLCSGIYGYFYGLGFFATPVMQRRERNGIHTLIPDFLHRIFHFRKDIIFHYEMTTLGLLIAMGLHGLYNFILHMNITFTIFGEEKISAHIIFLPLILVSGFVFLNFLLTKKEDQERFGRKREVFSPTLPV